MTQRIMNKRNRLKGNLKLGSLIRYYRKSQRVTQRELAEKLKCNKSYVSFIENGQTPAFFEDITVISKYLNIPLKLLTNIFI